MIYTNYPKDPLQQVLSYFGTKFDIDSSIAEVQHLLESISLPEYDIYYDDSVELLQADHKVLDIPDTLIPSPFYLN